MFKVIETELYGLYNMVCKGSCSRYDVALEFLKLLGLEDKIKIIIVDSDHFKREYFAPRPYSEKLINLKLESRGINYMLDWKDCLKEYVTVYREALKNSGYKLI
jgi:dTDP-4-dehydrorhamnose reductase